MSTTVTREELEQRVFSALEEFGAEAERIGPDSTFESLDVDSLDIVELAQIVEDEYGVKPVSYTHLTLPTTPYV